MTKVLVISGDLVDAHMGGVGVRNWEIAHALSSLFDVTLAAPDKIGLESQSVRLIPFDLQKGDLRELSSGMDVIILHGFVLHFHPYLRDLGIPLAVDLSVPYLLESLVWHDQGDWNAWIPAYEEYTRVQNELIRVGDFFFCANERQRDYWLGWLNSNKRINPHTFRQDPSLRKLLEVVPYGIPAGKPEAAHPVLKGVHPGIAQDDFLILWSGGLWDWLDPLTLIAAMGRLSSKYPRLKLYFLGTRHPNPVVSGMDMPEKAIRLSQELGLYDRSVFFGDWAPYQARGAYLAEANLGVICHPAHIETHFSFRTRLLDCIWAGLPLIMTEGDELSELVQRERLGYVVPPQDSQALATAIERLMHEIENHEFSPNFEHLQKLFQWDAVIEPLRSYCLAPNIAPDKGRYLSETERISRDKEALLQKASHKIEELEQTLQNRNALIDKYQKSLPLRVYTSLKSILRQRP